MNRSLADSRAFCAEVTRREAGNFRHGIKLLPRPRREAMQALYAFLRRTDDLADEPGAVEEKKRALGVWRAELEQSLLGRMIASSWPGMPALVEAARTYEIPPVYLRDAIDGAEMDLEFQPFARFAELEKYCERVASSVGLACLHIWGFESEQGRAESLARETGLALQLTNILRDLREDWALGRVYLPIEDLERFGIEPSQLGGQEISTCMRELIAFEVDRASTYYAAAGQLEPLINPAGRPMLRAVVGIYKALLEEIVRRNHDSLSNRVSLPLWRKVAIAWRAVWSTPRTPRSETIDRSLAPAPTPASVTHPSRHVTPPLSS
jgi:15-cis-phytoene synthase